MGKPKQPKTLREAIKQAISRSEMTRYKISQETGIPEATLSRFVNEDSDIRLSTVDALLPVLGLTWALAAKGSTK